MNGSATRLATVLMVLLTVSGFTVAPAAAADDSLVDSELDTEVDSDGGSVSYSGSGSDDDGTTVSVDAELDGDSDGGSVSLSGSSDDGTTVSVDGDSDGESVSLSGSGTDGDQSGSVECEVDSDGPSQDDCEYNTSSGDGGDDSPLSNVTDANQSDSGFGAAIYDAYVNVSGDGLGFGGSLAVGDRSGSLNCHVGQEGPSNESCDYTAFEGDGGGELPVTPPGDGEEPDAPVPLPNGSDRAPDVLPGDGGSPSPSPPGIGGSVSVGDQSGSVECQLDADAPSRDDCSVSGPGGDEGLPSPPGGDENRTAPSPPEGPGDLERFVGDLVGRLPLPDGGAPGIPPDENDTTLPPTLGPGDGDENDDTDDDNQNDEENENDNDDSPAPIGGGGGGSAPIGGGGGGSAPIGGGGDAPVDDCGCDGDDWVNVPSLDALPTVDVPSPDALALGEIGQDDTNQGNDGTTSDGDSAPFGLSLLSQLLDVLSQLFG